jgi:hypothetical protein
MDSPTCSDVFELHAEKIKILETQKNRLIPKNINSKSKTIYFASKGSDSKNIEKIADLLSINQIITHDWTKFYNVPQFIKDNKILLETYIKVHCNLDLEGVIDADIVVYNFDDKDYPYIGAINEITCGGTCKNFQLWKKLYVISPFDYGESVHTSQLFYWNNKIDKYFKSWNEFIDFLIEEVCDYGVKKYSFDEIRELLCGDKVGNKIYRNKETEIAYLKHKLDISRKFITIDEYLFQKYFNDDAPYKFDINFFPYNIEDDISHYILWLNPTCFKSVEDENNTAKKLIDDKFKDKTYFYGANAPSNKSVHSITHYHIFVKN